MIIVGLNGTSVDESPRRLLGDVITEGPHGPSLGTSSVAISIFVIYWYMCGNVGEVLIRPIGR